MQKAIVDSRTSRIIIDFLIFILNFSIGLIIYPYVKGFWYAYSITLFIVIGISSTAIVDDIHRFKNPDYNKKKNYIYWLSQITCFSGNAYFLSFYVKFFNNIFALIIYGPICGLLTCGLGILGFLLLSLFKKVTKN
jgi:hypothetical protein